MAIDHINNVKLHTDLSPYLKNLDTMIQMLRDLGGEFATKGFK
jgi:hypothetical protein